MGVSVFPAAATSTGFEKWFEVNSTTARISENFTPGLYQLTAINKLQASTPTVTVLFKNGSGATVLSATLLDTDTASTVNPGERLVRLSAPATSLEVASTAADIYFSVRRVAATLETTASIQLEYFTTSQQVTLNSSHFGALLLGAGGGSRGSGRNYPSSGSGGGGSGYIAVSSSLTPGTYSLVIGAGAGGATGGTSTFETLTAAGGGAGSAAPDQYSGGAGGIGGSNGGGGGAQYSTGGGAGGINGTPGSGVALPTWAPPSVAAANGAGGFYAGGTGGNANNSGASAADNTGGGAKGGAGYESTGTTYSGGSGVLILAKWV